MQLNGAFTALVTPLKNGALDEDAYRNLIDWQIEQGIDGLVPCGTTGEAATMTHEEQGRVIKVCVDQAKGRVPVIAGAGSNNTKEAVELTLLAKNAGADACLQITPYYNKPTPSGLLAHFKAIAKDASLPIVVYNVPGRTGLNLLPETLARIAGEVPEVIGVKEATANLQQVSRVTELCGKDFVLLSGDDFTVLPLLSVGGNGVISVVSNIVPKMMHELCAAFFDGRMDEALDLHLRMQPLNRAMFLETNPMPVKTSLSLMGKMGLEFRLPMVELEPDSLTTLKGVLQHNGLI